jgi:hypothetical protein
MLHNRVTGGYTGKAKSCIEAWVPAVSIHRPLSFYDFLKKQKKNNYKQIYIGVKKGGAPCRERGGERRRGGTQGGKGTRERVGSDGTSVIYMVRRLAEFKKSKIWNEKEAFFIKCSHGWPFLRREASPWPRYKPCLASWTVVKDDIQKPL